MRDHDEGRAELSPDDEAFVRWLQRQMAVEDPPEGYVERTVEAVRARLERQRRSWKPIWSIAAVVAFVLVTGGVASVPEGLVLAAGAVLYAGFARRLLTAELYPEPGNGP